MVSRFPRKAMFAVVWVLVIGIGAVLADSGAQHQSLQTPPIQLGTSGGNVNNITRRFCCSGTLGSLVSRGGVDYILSNNHILADSDTATVGDDISQPGLVDVNCNANNAQIVADFSEAPALGSTNVDAALAQIRSGKVDTTGAILDVGVPAGTTASIDNTAVGRGVAKSGRTTGLTCATISSINTNVQVQYQRNCGQGKKFIVVYTNQVLINSSSFSAGGDSGSLIVTTDTAQPIALLYAGSSTTTIGNRISDVTTTLGVNFVGGNTHQVTCPTGGKPQAALTPGAANRATAAKEAHARKLMEDPAVLAVGVGANPDNPNEPVVMIYVEEGHAHGPIPAELDGVRTQVIRTDAFRAYGWNEPAAKPCSAK